MDDAPVKDYWNVNDLAAFWGVTVGCVRAAAEDRRIPGCSRTPSGGFLRFDPKVAIEGWTPARLKGWLDDEAPRGTKLVRRTAEDRLATLSSAVTPDAWVSIILEAVSQAATGDWRARQWLSNYLLGPPIQRLIAKVEVEDAGGFEAGFRAAAIKTLLGEVRDRAEKQIIDVTSEEVEDASS